MCQGAVQTGPNGPILRRDLVPFYSAIDTGVDVFGGLCQQPVSITMDHRVCRYHFGKQQRAGRDAAVEVPAMPVRPIHHGRDGEFSGER